MTSTFYTKTVKMKEAFNDDDREHRLLEHRSDPLKRRFKRLKRLAQTNLGNGFMITVTNIETLSDH